jgi:neurotrimin
MTVSHVENRAWVLRIKDVKESDKGWYMCQINTDPMKNTVSYLNVVGKDLISPFTLFQLAP